MKNHHPLAGWRHRLARHALAACFVAAVLDALALRSCAGAGLPAAATGLRSASDSCPATVARLRDTKPAATWPPPCPLPREQAVAFTLHSMPITKDYCLAQRYEGAAKLQWERDDIEAKRKDCRGHVAHSGDVVGKRGLVLGSELPWIEILGAAEMWTMEYAEIVSTHPQLVTRTNKELAVSFLDGSLPQFDFIVSFSSIEHSGLGRYGDALNPDGDAEAMRQAHCFLKPGGLMLLGLPMTCREDGHIEFNAHRVYGYERLRYVTQGMEWLGFENGGCAATLARNAQPMLALRKPVMA